MQMVTATIAPDRASARASSSTRLSSDPSTSKPDYLARAPPGLKGKAVEHYATKRCIDCYKEFPKGLPIGGRRWNPEVLEEAYVRCGEVTSEYAKTFYMGTQLMTPQQAKAIWAIYVWCRRTDELVDGPNSGSITPQVRVDGHGPTPAVVYVL